MSDFDDFFGNKLGEEGQYPRREKNWRALSKRLDAFESGLQENKGNIHHYLKYWQAAAACFLIASGWLAWMVADARNENTELRRELVGLKKKNSVKEQEIARLKEDSNDNATIVTGLAAGIEKGKGYAWPEPSTSGKAHNVSPSSLNSQNQLANGATRKDASTSPAGVENSKSSGTAAIPDLNHTFSKSDSTTTQPADPRHDADVVSTPNDSIAGIAGVLPDSIRQAPLLPKPDTIIVAATPKLIEPVHNPSRLRAGIQVLTGLPLPKEKGVSLLFGQGVTTEFNLWRNLWLTASAEWLRFDVATEKYIPKFHSHHHNTPPQSGPPPEILVKVESTKRQQHYGLGLRYALPVRTWIRPVVRAAYTMIHESPELITFKFENQGGGPGGPSQPKYKVQKTESHMIQNTWRFGAGLEHETADWTFGIWADYSKNFAASDLTFDALMLRAGIQYNFN